MKYQSELIKEIVDTRGHEKSSIHYESECVESWIEETKGAYPKLCDYQSEWLNYINENPIGVFPYEIITDVTEATVNNVVPYAYKRAILKGNTLVNISSLSGEITIKPNANQIIESSLIQQNKTFTFIFNCTSVPSTGFIELRQMLDNTALKTENINVVQGYNKFKVTTVSSEINRFRLKNESTSDTDFVFNNLLILEGDYTNQDIPYFEGMQSVKMPVLTTMSKNFMSSEMEIGILNSNDGSLQGNPAWQRSTNFIALKSNTQYQLNDTALGKWFLFYDKDRNFISSIFARNGQFITPQNCVFVKFTVETNDLSRKWQIELGNTITEYEPYKSNILTVNEPVELRGIGEVQDELNLLTGELTQRIGEVVLDGSEKSWGVSGLSNQNETIIFQMNTTSDTHIPHPEPGSLPIAPKMLSNNVATDDLEGFLKCQGTNGHGFYVRINRNRLETEDVLGFKTWLSKNPLTVRYQLETESIKTVDLTVIDQDGNTLSRIKPIEGTMHIHSDGTPLNPSITMEIPVEATKQNLASFIKEE